MRDYIAFLLRKITEAYKLIPYKYPMFIRKKNDLYIQH